MHVHRPGPPSPNPAPHAATGPTAAFGPFPAPHAERGPGLPAGRPARRLPLPSPPLPRQRPACGAWVAGPPFPPPRPAPPRRTEGGPAGPSHTGGLGLPAGPPPRACLGSPGSAAGRPCQRGPRPSFLPPAGRGEGRARAAPARSPEEAHAAGLARRPSGPTEQAGAASPRFPRQARRPCRSITRAPRPGPASRPLPPPCLPRPGRDPLARAPPLAPTPVPVGGRAPASGPPAALAGPGPGKGRGAGGLARPQARAAPRWPPPAAVAARSRTPSAASSADMLGAPVPKAAAQPALPTAHVRALREGRGGAGGARPPAPPPPPRCSSRPGRLTSFAAYWLPLPVAHSVPSPPGGYWPSVLLTLPFLSVIGRSVRRSLASPARKLFPDWAFPLCFGNYWLRLLSVKAPEHGFSFSAVFFYPASYPGQDWRKRLSVSALAPPSLPPPATSFPSRRGLPAGHWLSAPPVPQPLSPRPRLRQTGVNLPVGAFSWLAAAPANKAEPAGAGEGPAGPGGAAERVLARAPLRTAIGRGAGGEGERCAASPLSHGGGGGAARSTRMFARLHHRQPIRGRGVRLLVAGGRGLAPARGSRCASRARGGRLRPAAGPGPVGGAAVFPTVKSEAGGASVLGVPSRRRRGGGQGTEHRTGPAEGPPPEK